MLAIWTKWVIEFGTPNMCLTDQEGTTLFRFLNSKMSQEKTAANHHNEEFLKRVKLGKRGWGGSVILLVGSPETLSTKVNLQH